MLTIQRDKLKADIAAQTRNLREADGNIKQFIQEDLQNLAEELRETERQLSKLDEGRKNNMIAIRDLEMTKERLLSFAEYAKDAQPEVLVTLIQTIVERIYIVDKDDERFCHIFIKGCSGEDYTGFFQTAGYIEQKTTHVCDSEQYCIDNIFFTYVFIRHFFPPLSRLYQSESEPIHFFESRFLDESEVIHSWEHIRIYIGIQFDCHRFGGRRVLQA